MATLHQGSSKKIKMRMHCSPTNNKRQAKVLYHLTLWWAQKLLRGANFQIWKINTKVISWLITDRNKITKLLGTKNTRVKVRVRLDSLSARRTLRSDLEIRKKMRKLWMREGIIILGLHRGKLSFSQTLQGSSRTNLTVLKHQFPLTSFSPMRM